MSTPTSNRRTGRRPGTTDTRDAIVRASREQFAETGYDRATIRKIAGAAGVDPALVVHFFGSKENLFREVMALPAVVADAMAALADGDRSTVGRRLAELVVAVLENPATRVILVGRIRSAASHPEAATLVRETVSRDMLRIATALDTDQPELRATLVGAHVVGVAMVRYIVDVEPLASVAPETLIDLLAPDFQRYLVGTL
jgi:AcrR family transcriptional regulator